MVAAVSSSAAGCITNPIDVIKTEMQLAGRAVGKSSPVPGIFGTLKTRVASRGVVSLWAGVPVMMVKSLFYAGIRVGAYEPIRDALGGKEKPSMFNKLMAGTLSGTVAAAAANPVEVIRTRLMAEPSRYRSTRHAVVSLARDEGLGGLSKGLVPHMLRGAAVTASQLAFYDESKHRLKAHVGMQEGIPLRFAAAMVSGVATTTMSSPFDVIKTQVMARGGSVIEVTRRIASEEGMSGFFRGWLPNYARLGPHTVIVFIVYEQVRSWSGLGAL